MPVATVEGLCNPRGFVIIDEHQRNPKYQNIYLGRRLRRHPAGRGHAGADRRAQDRLHDRVHGHGHRAQHPRRTRRQAAPTTKATWNAICLADMGDTGAAFVALPQIPPRNVTWFKKGKWVHLAKIAFEKYFIRKMKKGTSEPVYEKYMLKMLGIKKLK